MRFKGLDLNLLVALDALLETRSVSAAARRLRLGQPAMSAALARLRDYFQDDLLILDGKRMYPTAYAEDLAPRLRAWLQGADALIAEPAAFDPATAQRVFRLVASDFVTVAAVGPLVARLASTAPRIRIDLVVPSPESDRQLSQGEVDLLIRPEAYIGPEHPAELLFEERQVVAGWSGNPIFSHALTTEAVLAAGHVAVAIGGDGAASFADRQAAIMGLRRRIEATAASFTTVPWMLEGTARLTLMHERLARKLSRVSDIAYAPLPFDFPLMREMVQHHRARSNDESLQWLRTELRREAG